MLNPVEADKLHQGLLIEILLALQHVTTLVNPRLAQSVKLIRLGIQSTNPSEEIPLASRFHGRFVDPSRSSRARVPLIGSNCVHQFHDV